MLYLILPYFDFIQSIYSKKNLDLFISNYAQRANLRIVLCEGIYREELPDYSYKIFKHLKFKLKDILWVKENLINLAIKSLPEDAEFIAWSDRDIYFTNTSWVEDTIEKLKTHDVVQPWSEVIHLNSSNTLHMIKKNEQTFSFSDKSQLYATMNHRQHNNKISTSTGQIWAINKSFYKKIKKINDIEIIGGADSIIANFCILQKSSYIKNLIAKTTSESKKQWIEYSRRFKDIKYSYVDGLIIHYWHGPLQDRLYTSRHDILKHYNYDPYNDIIYDENGVLQFTQKGKRLQIPVAQYFAHRKESELKIEESENQDNLPFYYKYKVGGSLTPIISSENYEN
jgi:hypothetical protein